MVFETRHLYFLYQGLYTNAFTVSYTWHDSWILLNGSHGTPGYCILTLDHFSAGDLMKLANGFSGKPNNVQGPRECWPLKGTC